MPQLWHFEMRNILLAARRRQRISAQGLAERIASLADLPLRTDTDPDLAALIRAARAEGLPVQEAV